MIIGALFLSFAFMYWWAGVNWSFMPRQFVVNSSWDKWFNERKALRDNFEHVVGGHIVLGFCYAMVVWFVAVHDHAQVEDEEAYQDLSEGFGHEMMLSSTDPTTVVPGIGRTIMDQHDWRGGGKVVRVSVTNKRESVSVEDVRIPANRKIDMTHMPLYASIRVDVVEVCAAHQPCELEAVTVYCGDFDLRTARNSYENTMGHTRLERDMCLERYKRDRGVNRGEGCQAEAATAVWFFEGVRCHLLGRIRTRGLKFTDLNGL
jgi:hypothetical protein